MNCTYTTKGTCSKSIKFKLNNDGTVADVEFEGGCHGNTQGISALAQGQDARWLIGRLKGLDCRGRGTSCPDQLAQALEKALGELAQ